MRVEALEVLLLPMVVRIVVLMLLRLTANELALGA